MLTCETLLHLGLVYNHLAVSIGKYTDLHAKLASSMLRGPANALQANYTHLAVAYHSRSSSVMVWRTPIHRPLGQILLDPAAEAKKQARVPSERLDIELELGVAELC